MKTFRRQRTRNKALWACQINNWLQRERERFSVADPGLESAGWHTFEGVGHILVLNAMALTIRQNTWVQCVWCSGVERWYSHGKIISSQKILMDSSWVISESVLMWERVFLRASQFSWALKETNNKKLLSWTLNSCLIYATHWHHFQEMTSKIFFKNTWDT